MCKYVFLCVGIWKFVPRNAKPPEASRGRKDTANQVLTILRATLSWGATHELAPARGPWTQMKSFPTVEACNGPFLIEEER
jgi:hypothetical protein